MLGWALLFFALSLVAAFVGFAGFTPELAGVGWLGFAFFVVIFLALSVFYGMRGKHPPA